MQTISKDKIKQKLTSFFSFESLNSDSKENNITLNIEDINKITKNKDLLVMSSAEQYCLNSAKKAIKLIILDFEKNNKLLTAADGILVYFQVNSNYNVMDFAEAMEIIYDRWNDKSILKEPDVIFGVSFNSDYKDNYVKATMFMGYSNKSKSSYSNNYILSSSI